MLLNLFRFLKICLVYKNRDYLSIFHHKMSFNSHKITKDIINKQVNLYMTALLEKIQWKLSRWLNSTKWNSLLTLVVKSQEKTKKANLFIDTLMEVLLQNK